MSLPKKENKSMTVQDIIFAIITLVVGFVMINLVPDSIPHKGLFILLSFCFGASGPIVFIVKFFKQPIKKDEDLST